MNHPLKVYHSGSGVYYVCRWWSHQEQNSIIIARTEELVKKVWSSTYKKCRNAEAKEVLEVELVAPSILMCENAAKKLHKDEVTNLLNEVTSRFDELIGMGFAIPKQFVECDKWESLYEEEGGYEPSPATLQYHFYCKNCVNKFKLVSLTPEEFYEAFVSKWDSNFPVQDKYEYKYTTTYSRARAAGNDEQIWAATTTDFGHHNKGVSLDKWEIGAVPSNFGDILFYYSLLNVLDVEPYKKEASIFSVEEDKNRKEIIKLAAIQREEKKRKEAEKLLSIFA